MTDTEQKELTGKRLEELVKDSEKNQKQIAQDLDVEPNTMNQWIKGKAMPSLTMLRKMAAYFGVPLLYLLEEDKNEGQTKGLPLKYEQMYKNLDEARRSKVEKAIEEAFIRQTASNIRSKIKDIIDKDSVESEEDARTFIYGMNNNYDLFGPYGEILFIRLANEILPYRKQNSEPSGRECITIVRNILELKKNLSKFIVP